MAARRLLFGVAAWFAGGGYDAVEVDSVHPVLGKAVTYWWRVIPGSVLGALIFALWTARAVPLHAAARSRPD